MIIIKWKGCCNFLKDPKVIFLSEGVKNERKELHVSSSSFPFFALSHQFLCNQTQPLSSDIIATLFVWYCGNRDFHKVINNYFRMLKVFLLQILEATWEGLTCGEMRMRTITIWAPNPCMTRSSRSLVLAEHGIWGNSR